MKKICSIVSVFLLIFSAEMQAWNGHTPEGARAGGMAGMSLTLCDVWSVYNNQAGLGNVKKFSAGLSVQNKFGLKELNSSALVAALPTKQGTFGLSYYLSGQTSFREQKIGLAYGRAFTKNFSFGFQLNYLNTHIPAYGNSNKLCIETGLIVQLVKNLKLGVHVFNPTFSRMSEYNDERIPLLAVIGITYEPSSKLLIAAELEKNSVYPLNIRSGLEYKISNTVSLRTGLSTKPFLSTFGFSIQLKKFTVDIASGYHQQLGFTPHLSVNYSAK